jgi:NADPH-dependent curcumin reductase CurA
MCPKGISIIVDSFGGLPLEQCLNFLRPKSQVILLNTLPIYNQGVASLGNLISNSSKLQGSNLDQ